MFSRIYNYFSSIHYSKPLSDIRLALFIYWHTKSKAPVVIIFVLLLASSLAGWGMLATINDVRHTKDVTCLALNIYHEARGEPKAGQYAVANVTLNRVKSRHYPNDTCAVVFQKNWDKRRRRYVSAFSWTELDYRSNRNTKEWKQALKIAESVYGGSTKTNAKDALFYHANYIKPRWAKNKKSVARIGKHIFYN